MLTVQVMCISITFCLKMVMSVLLIHVRMAGHALMELQAIVAIARHNTLVVTVNKDSGVPQTHVRMEACVLKQLTPSCATAQSSILVILVNRGGDAFLIHAKMEVCVVKDPLGLTAPAHHNTMARTVNLKTTVCLIPVGMV